MTETRDGTPINGVDLGDRDDRKSLSAHEFAALADDTDATTERHQTTGVKLRNQRKSFVSIKLWVAFMTLTATFLATDAIVRYAVLTTLERRFGFTSVFNGVLVSAYDMGHVLALVVLSIVGHKVHRPRVCAIGGFLSTVSGLLFAMPHFLYGPGVHSEFDSHAPNVTTPSLGLTLCSPHSGPMTDPCLANVTRTGGDMATESTVAFAVFFLSQCLLGAGFAPYLTIAITYLDDNAEPAYSAVGVSVFLSVISLGPMMGFLLGALTTSTFVDLSNPDMTPDDPRWIGAWWLGSLVLAVVIFFSSLPLTLFPRNLQTDEAVARHRRSRHISVRSQGSDIDAILHSRADKMRHMLQRRLSELSSITSVKEVPRQSGSLLLNVVFVCQTLTLCCFQYCMAGLLPFLPKYLETQFHVDTFVANIITSIAIAFANAAGTFSGGVLAAVRELGPRGLVRLIVIGLFLGSCCFIGTMFLGCPQSSLAGALHDGTWNATGVCNANCACPSDFGPVCGSDNVTYFSACYAGCRATGLADGAGGLKTYDNCSCVGDVTSGIAQSGWCDYGCSTLVPYAILTFMAMFFVSLGASPMMVTLTRCVDQEKKSLSLGVANVLTSLLSSIPGPMLYGRLVDQTCVARERTCPGDDTTGACIMYDNAAFRYYLHGLTNGAILLGMVFMSIAYLRLRHTKSFNGTERAADIASPTEEQPMTEVDPLNRQ